MAKRFLSHNVFVSEDNPFVEVGLVRIFTDKPIKLKQIHQELLHYDSIFIIHYDLATDSFSRLANLCRY